MCPLNRGHPSWPKVQKSSFAFSLIELPQQLHLSGLFILIFLLIKVNIIYSRRFWQLTLIILPKGLYAVKFFLLKFGNYTGNGFHAARAASSWWNDKNPRKLGLCAGNGKPVPGCAGPVRIDWIFKTHRIRGLYGKRESRCTLRRAWPAPSGPNVTW